MQNYSITVALLSGLLLGLPAFPGASHAAGLAGDCAFDVPMEGWTHQRFRLFGGNDWQQGDGRIGLRSDGSVSLLWRPVAAEARGASGMGWSWQVTQSVPPTPLDVKGGDDRNLSLYAVFLPAAIAAQAEGRGVRSLLNEPSARVLIYVWGGSHDRGERLESPYLGPRGRSIVLRPAGEGAYRERVDFAADLRAAFGEGDDLALVALAISGDSDDTATAIRATLSDIVLY